VTRFPIAVSASGLGILLALSACSSAMTDDDMAQAECQAAYQAQLND
jgi:hypothetical protein